MNIHLSAEKTVAYPAFEDWSTNYESKMCWSIGLDSTNLQRLFQNMNAQKERT